MECKNSATSNLLQGIMTVITINLLRSSKKVDSELLHHRTLDLNLQLSHNIEVVLKIAHSPPSNSTYFNRQQ